MHVLIAKDWLDHDYIARHTLGLAALRERAPAVARRSASPRSAASTARRGRAAWRATTARSGRRRSASTTACSACAAAATRCARSPCLPALVGAWRDPAGGLLLSTSGTFPVDGRRLQRPDLLGGPHAAHDQHDHDRRRPAARRPRRRFGPRSRRSSSTTAIRSRSRRESREVRHGFAREDLFTVVLEHFRTDTADYADILLPATTQLEHLDVHTAYGHPYVLVNKPAIAPLGEALPNTRDLPPLAARMGFDEPCFGDDDDALARQAFNAAGRRRASTSTGCARSGWEQLDDRPTAPFAEGGFPTPSGKCEFDRRVAAASIRCPTTSAELRIGRVSNPGAGGALSARVDLAAGAQLPELDLRQRHEPARLEGEPHARDPSARRRRARHRRRRAVRVFNDRGSFACTARVDRARAARRGAALVDLVAEARARRHATPTSSRTSA